MTDTPKFTIAERVYRAVETRPYERSGNDPVHRPLRIFSLDPSVSRLDGAVATVNVPYEPLEPGPVGELLVVDAYDRAAGARYRAANLDDPNVLIRDGYDPSPSDPRFHQQMVYAVASLVYAAFRSALGRDIAWGFDGPGADGDTNRLVLRPHGARARNASYDKSDGTISFGYFRAEKNVAGRNQPEGWVFTCLSHDIIVHETTHALLDGLRAHFAFPSGADVLAFHEAFADTIAIFQHFSYQDVVKTAIRRARADLRRARLLTSLATQFGHTTGSDRPLRTAIDIDRYQNDRPRQHGESNAPHARGAVLTEAIFDAFVTVFERKIERYVRLASSGSGILPEGEIHPDLAAVLAEQASKLANQFRTICIRAIDYCPPVDLEFGEYLRAVITADQDLVPDDPWGYREAWIDAFRRRGIYPPGAHSLSDDALLWRPPRRAIPEQPELGFGELRFRGDPGCAAGKEELARQANALGRLITDERFIGEFGFCLPGDVRPGSDTIEPPCIESIRTSRRVGPDGRVVFDLVAEITQKRIVRVRGRKPSVHYGGTTIIVDPRGAIRYAVSKNVLNAERLKRQRAFMASPTGRRFWKDTEHGREPVMNPFALLHDGAAGEAGGEALP